MFAARASWIVMGLVLACTTEPDAGPQDAGKRAQTIADAKAAGTIEVSCTGGAAIDSALRQQITAAAREAYDRLRAGDIDALWGALHPQARRKDGREPFDQAMRAASARLQSSSGEPTLEHVHHVDVRGGASALARVQCGKPSDADAFELVANAGDEDLAIATFVTKGEPFTFATTLQLRKRGEQWRLLGVQAGPAGYRGKSAEAFEAQGEAFTKQQRVVPGYLALAVASQLASRGSAMKRVRQARIEQKLAALERSELFKAELGPWSVGGKTYEVAGLSLASTKADLSPVIKYVTPGGLIREVLDTEADQLVAHVKARYPELARNFDAVVFEAYAEAPTTANREYDAYRVARYFDPR